MPRRKSSLPAKLTQNFSASEIIFNGKSSCSKTGKRVTFHLENQNESANWENNKIKTKKIYKTHSLKNSIVLGELSFQLNEGSHIDFSLTDATDLRILVNDARDFIEVILRVVAPEKNDTISCSLNITSEILLRNIPELLTHKYYWILNDENCLSDGELKINVATTAEKMPILKATNIVHLLFGKPCTSQYINSNSKKKVNMNEFFKEIQNHQKNNLQMVDCHVQHEMLIPLLRPYQVRAVKWMMFRENARLQPQDTEWMSEIVDTFTSKSGQNVYYNKHTGTMCLHIGDFSLLPLGGILADEMGLGKTVVAISLILNHPAEVVGKEEKEFLSPLALTVIRSKIIANSDETVEHNKEVIAKNKEGYMNADEKLYYNKVSRGSALKRALTEWYEAKLAEFSAGTPSKIRKTDVDEIKCICGKSYSGEKEKCVECPECNRYQHVKCVRFDKKYLYFCPSCWPKQKLVRSRATLIIAPASIYHQWFEEISKHVKPEGFPNGVFMYNGLRDGFVQPSVLASYDVVITTYATLRGEINHAATHQSERILRNEERFMKMSSPLKQVRWWRMCLDEAQTVESDHSQVNEMANLISAVNRWSVTGTPVQKSINELYHLIEWLGIEPFTAKPVWNDLLYKPYIDGVKGPMLSVIGKVFWRNSKDDVADELQLPEQKVKYHILKFSAIEQNFYMREHAASSADFSERLAKLKLNVDRTIDSLDKTTLTSLLAPLLNLRQACSHPMAVKGSKIYSKTGSMTLAELLDYLFNKTKVECEDAMRQHVAALNGLAGVHSIIEDWKTAVDYYRQVLNFTEEYKDRIQIDSLQRIHTMTNLAEILQVHTEGIPPTLRDDTLKADAKALEDKYMGNAISVLKSDEAVLTDLTNKVSALVEKFETGSGIWWNRLIHLLTIEGAIDELRDKIESELFTSELESKKQVEVFLSKISSVKGIEIMLRNWVSEVEENRTKAMSRLEELRKMPSDDLVYQAVDCHLRTMLTETKRKKCPLCQCESVLLDYECSLFDVSRKLLKENYEKVLDGAQTKGSWRAKKAEKCLRALLTVSKSKSGMETWCLNDGKNHIQLLEAMKKEFKQLRAVWMSLNHRIQALDEISMCKLRLRLRLPDEPLPPKITNNLSLNQHNKIETIFIIENHEIEPMKLKLQSDLDLSKSEFKKKYGTLLYLKNLGQKGNPKPDPCPVCKSVLDNEWCVLQCGHSYCIDCLRIMLNRSPKPSLSCPVCREVTKSCDLSFIDLNGQQEDSDISVVGDHSTKVDGILRSLLQLKRNDPRVKVLIFSTWAVVLKILEVALTQNGISFRRMPGHNYQEHLKQFKDPNLNVTVLLLPISWGSKGLNLTEATHVFLVEPIMNPAEELQAIGRVHRIGQTRETVVHRFLISGTIEEKIHTAVSEGQDKWDSKKVTLDDLKNLFDMKNDFMTTSPGLLRRNPALDLGKAVITMAAKRPSSDMSKFRSIFKQAKCLLILTGAGVSAESGIPTFRGPGGYWRKYQAQNLATPEAFHANPSLVWEFYHHRREVAMSKEPNNAHKAIAECQSRLDKEGRKVWIITQNIDELHKRAGAKDVVELHGSLFRTRCLKCGTVEENYDSPVCPALAGKGAPDPGTMSADIPEEQLPRCKKENCGGLLRPHIVWFGENLESHVLELAEKAVAECDLCLVVGTSSVVYPAALFAPQVAMRGIPVAEFNLEKTPATNDFEFHFEGPCGVTIPVALEA